MAKSKYEKMEVMLEEIMNESDIDTKIEEMKKDIKEAPKGKGRTKEEYKESILEDKKKKEQLGKKLKLYEGFKNNKDQILNIREYQLSLQVELDKLEKEQGIVEKIVKDSESINANMEKIDKELAEIMAKREEIAKQLKRKDLTEEERNDLLDKDEKLIKDRYKNAQKYQVIQNYKSQNADNEYRSVEEISKEIASTQIKISKCNMIWSSLLKDKDWDQIEVILNTGDFTAEKGTIDKIRNLKEATQSKEKDITRREHISETIPPKGTIENNASQVEEEKRNLPAKIKTTFKDRHPRLARIPFLARIIDGINNYRDTSKEEAKMEAKIEAHIDELEVMQNDTRTLEHDDEKALKYIDKRMKHNEVEMFKSIAKNGWKESMRVDLEQRRAEARKVASKREAEKLHGRYENSNGNKEPADD